MIKVAPDAKRFVDGFAGGGGAGEGIVNVLGRPVDLAINHDAGAIAMYTDNHPAGGFW